MKIIMLGAPGAGKGTQAKMIAEKYGIPHVSTGDIFRANIKNGTELGMEAKKYMDQGQLVPDELTVKILLDRVAQDDCKNGYVLDGFPRTIPQAEVLDKALTELGDAIDFARRFFDCPDYPSAVHRSRRCDMGFLDTFYQDKLPSRAVTVYLYLRERSNKDGTCFPSIPTVSRDTGLSEATVKRAIGDLIAAGWLQKEPRLRRNGARSSNLYLLKH